MTNNPLFEDLNNREQQTEQKVHEIVQQAPRPKLPKQILQQQLHKKLRTRKQQ